VSTGEQIPTQPEPRPWPLAPEPEPRFGLAAVFVVFLAMLLAVVACGVLAMFIAHRVPALRYVRPADLALDPRVLLPAQFGAYLLVFAGLYRFFYHQGIGLGRALSWRWPPYWLRFIAAGSILGILVQGASQWLPSPPELPIDQMMRTTIDGWLMTVFGILIAPVVEEALFRGLLFPALTRRAGAPISLVLTSLLFGAVHAQQLGGAWMQVSLIVFVGAVLTAIRWRFRSLASSTLTHAGYNGILFAALFVQTHGFTHFPAQ
jgi:CAAX protease family protein